MIGSDDSFDFLQDPWRDDPKILFDGVRGELPEWVPNTNHRELHATRSRLQFYSYDDLLRFVTEVRDYYKGVNVTFSAPLEIHQEILTLAHFHAVVSLGKEAGLALLMGPKHAELVKKGTDYGTHQSKNASKPRGKINTNNGETTTISKIIKKLATKYEFADWAAIELWETFYGELDKHLLNPEENTDSPDNNKWSISYDFNDERKLITFGQFSNVVSEARSNKKSG